MRWWMVDEMVDCVYELIIFFIYHLPSISYFHLTVSLLFLFLKRYDTFSNGKLIIKVFEMRWLRWEMWFDFISSFTISLFHPIISSSNLIDWRWDKFTINLFIRRKWNQQTKKFTIWWWIECVYFRWRIHFSFVIFDLFFWLIWEIDEIVGW